MCMCNVYIPSSFISALKSLVCMSTRIKHTIFFHLGKKLRVFLGQQKCSFKSFTEGALQPQLDFVDDFLQHNVPLRVDELEGLLFQNIQKTSNRPLVSLICFSFLALSRFGFTFDSHLYQEKKHNLIFPSKIDSPFYRNICQLSQQCRVNDFKKKQINI